MNFNCWWMVQWRPLVYLPFYWYKSFCRVYKFNQDLRLRAVVRALLAFISYYIRSLIMVSNNTLLTWDMCYQTLIYCAVTVLLQFNFKKGRHRSLLRVGDKARHRSLLRVGDKARNCDWYGWRPKSCRNKRVCIWVKKSCRTKFLYNLFCT